MTKNTRLLSAPVEVSSRRIALYLLNNATKASQRLRASEGPESLHDFRVSVRRTRTGLRAYRSYLGKRIGNKLVKELDKLIDATNSGRDDEVQLLWLQKQLTRRRVARLERTGLRLMLDELEACREAIAPEAIEKVFSNFVAVSGKLRDRLRGGRAAVRLDSSGQCTLFSEATGRVLYATTVKLRTHLGLIVSATDTRQSHDARLLAKQLRYLLDPVRKEITGASQALRSLKRLQDMLGELHDLQVLEKRVASAIKRASDHWADKLIDTASTAQRLGQITRNRSELRACYALAALARRIGSQQRSLFRTFSKRWLGGNAEPFFDQMHRMICDLLPDEQAPADPEPLSEDDSAAPLATPSADQADQVTPS